MLGRVAMLFSIIALALLPGCRMFVSNARNQSLLTARQLSLRGTDAMQPRFYGNLGTNEKLSSI
jgi:hypothetical protein